MRLAEWIFDRAHYLIFIALACFVVASLSLMIYTLSVDKQCLAAGYPSAQVSVDFQAYCVKRVDQTDVVVPLGAVAH